MSLRAAALLCLLLGTTGCGVRGVPQPWKPRLVILLSIDTCRADHLHCYGYQRPTSPNLDRLASEGVRFSNAFSQSNESLFSYASMFTGSYPRQLAPLSHNNFRLSAARATLASTLRGYGYRTAAFVAGGHLSSQFGFSNGFDVYQDEWNFGSCMHTVPPALRWLERSVQESGPVFLFIQGYDAHDPYSRLLTLYDPHYDGIADAIVRTPGGIERVYRDRYYARIPADMQAAAERRSSDLFDPMYLLPQMYDERCPSTLLSDSDVKHLIAAYDGAITYSDVWVGLLRAKLAELGVEQQTLLVVMGDHGEELLDQEFFSHRVNLHDSSLHVPLIVWGPGGIPAHRQVSQIAELRSLCSTISDLAGVPSRFPAPSLRHVMQEPEPGVAPMEVAVSEGISPEATIRTSQFRLVYRGDRRYDPQVLQHLGGTPLDSRHFHLYDVVADPREHTDLTNSHVEAADNLRHLLLNRLSH